MSTLSAWLRDIPLNDAQRNRLRRRPLDAIRMTSRANHERRLAREAHIKRTTAAQIGPLSGRDLFIAGVVAYAAEGSKQKPWQTSRTVSLTNSDPRMIRLFLRWLTLLGVEPSCLAFRVSIHQDADVEAALRYWSGVVGIPPDLFQRTTLKKGNPKTPRRNTGPGYYGCLVVSVRRSGDLNKQLAGWFEAIADNLADLTRSEISIPASVGSTRP